MLDDLKSSISIQSAEETTQRSDTKSLLYSVVLLKQYAVFKEAPANSFRL